MLYEEGEQAGLQATSLDPVGHLAGKVVQTSALGGQGDAVGVLFHTVL